MLYQLLRFIAVCQSLFSTYGLTTILCWPNNDFKSRPLFKFPTVILISFDGFRWDYLERVKLKNFKYILENGVRAKSLESSFITKTFPNHFTLVTGLYEESHGIIGSTMYDPVFNETFHPSTTDSKWWNASTPLWILNELQPTTNLSVTSNPMTNNTNGGRKSAAIFWIGSNVKYNGRMPYFYKPVYNSSFSFQERFQLIIKLLKEEEPPNFIACYFHEPDATAHKHGPESENVNNVLRLIDRLLGQFLDDLKKEGFLPYVNIVIVSDHGMTSIEPQNQIVLDDFIDRAWYTAIDINVFASIIPKDNYTNKLYNKMKNIPHLTTFLKTEIPDELHYKKHRRVPPIFAIADEGYIIKQTKEDLKHTIGNHGYLDKLKSMHGIFLAMGPAFKRGYIGETFKNIHVYTMLCHILDIEPSPNNGSFFEIEHFLTDSQKQHFRNRAILLKVILICGVILVTVLSLGCYLHCKRNSLMVDGYVKLSTRSEDISLDILTKDLSLHQSSDDDDI